MLVHIGEIIKSEVENQRLTQKEFGELIYKNEKTIPDIYERSSMQIDLLITISKALNKDFLNVFYEAEPLKSLRDDEVAKLNIQMQLLKEEIKRLQKELALTQNMFEAQKEIMWIAIEHIIQSKLISRMI